MTLIDICLLYGVFNNYYDIIIIMSQFSDSIQAHIFIKTMLILPEYCKMASEKEQSSHQLYLIQKNLQTIIILLN